MIVGGRRLCEARMGSFGHPYLAGNLTDLCRADNSYGCSDVVLVFLVTSAFGIVELLRFCDRAFQL